LAITRDDPTFSTEILHLFNVIANLDQRRKFFTKDERIEIYANKIFIVHAGVKSNLTKMMTRYDESLFTALAEVFVKIKASNAFVENYIMLCEIEGVTLLGVAIMIIEHINDQQFTVQACQIFKAVFQFLEVPDEFRLIQGIHEIINKCGENEIAYGTFIEFLIETSPSLFTSAIARNVIMRNALIASLFSSLMKFSYPETVRKILELIKVKF
jgi:hypothetical protein